LNADDDHDSTNGDRCQRHPGHPCDYEDRAYGGAGRDILIGNTGGDRLIDWVGEFNSYLVPFAPFGMGHGEPDPAAPACRNSSTRSPASDGADPTRATDTGADPARNGEPFGELGVVRQKDFAWQDQTGAPADPQAGNIPGGKRDVLRSANFDGDSTTALHGFYVDSGAFTVEKGALQVTAESLGGDAAAVFHVDEALPGYFEIQASVLAVKPTSGWKANSYVIFDYQSATDFKFAGINVSTNKLVMGHRDAAGWHVDAQAVVRGGVKDNQFYNVLLAINGTNVTLVVNNQLYFTHTYAPRVDADGWAYGINAGMVGVGSDNSRGVFDNITVQVLPPAITLAATEEFPDTHAGVDFVLESGSWRLTENKTRYDGVPLNGDPMAVSLVDLGIDHGLNVSSILEFQATFSTRTTGGVVFDYYGPDFFKFAAIDASANKVVIGHYTAKGGWVTDAGFDMTINPGTDYVLNLSLKGTTAGVSVKESGKNNWQAMVGHVFNAVTVDGGFGLLSRDGASSFDEVTVKTDDRSFPVSNLMAVAAPVAAAPVNTLTEKELVPIVDEAIERWIEVLDADTFLVEMLRSVEFQILDLDGLILGQTTPDVIFIDIDAAGWGWFVDETPWDDFEFGLSLSEFEQAAFEDSAAFGRMDLLTVVMHELGHVIGYDDLDPDTGDLMSATLEAGKRVAPSGDTQSLVVMDTSDLMDGEDTRDLMAAMENDEDSWLVNFLVKTARERVNPFEPREIIRIKITEDEIEEE
jgi:hypothetical protein